MLTITDHEEKLGLLIDYYNNSTKISDLTRAFLGELNLTETLLLDIYNSLDLDTSEGVHLDRIVRLVGEIRNSPDDEVYRLNIKIRIAVNNSRGTLEDLISVIRLLYGKDILIKVSYTSPATVSLYLGMDEPSEDVITLLQQTIPAGVRIQSILYASDALPWIPTERGGVIQETGVLPERGDTSPTVRIPPERI